MQRFSIPLTGMVFFIVFSGHLMVCGVLCGGLWLLDFAEEFSMEVQVLQGGPDEGGVPALEHDHDGGAGGDSRHRGWGGNVGGDSSDSSSSSGGADGGDGGEMGGSSGAPVLPGGDSRDVKGRRGPKPRRGRHSRALQSGEIGVCGLVGVLSERDLMLSELPVHSPSSPSPPALHMGGEESPNRAPGGSPSLLLGHKEREGAKVRRVRVHDSPDLCEEGSGMDAAD